MNELPAKYGPLIQELLRRASHIRQPASGVFEITERCNLSCEMCYMRQSARDEAMRAKELSAAQWLALAEDAANNGMVFLLLTGGEVFLRSDFFEIYTPLTKMGLVLTLFTNGTLVSGRVAERLAEAPPSLVQITLYGATSATYEAVTGVSGAYSLCCAGIEALLKQRIRLELKTTVTRHNFNEVDAMRQMARNWGLPFTPICLIMQRRDNMPADIDGCRLSPQDCIAVEASDRAASKRPPATMARRLTVGSDVNFNCHVGKSAFVVNSSGEMSLCLNLPQPVTRPLTGGFLPAWKSLQHFVDDSPLLDGACVNCSLRSYCPRCPAWSLMETGTLNRAVPYLCEIARLRKEQSEQMQRADIAGSL